MNNDQKEFWELFDEITLKATTHGINVLFRGIPNKEYELIPSIGRGTEKGLYSDINMLESSMVTSQKVRANEKHRLLVTNPYIKKCKKN